MIFWGGVGGTRPWICICRGGWGGGASPALRKLFVGAGDPPPTPVRKTRAVTRSAPKNAFSPAPTNYFCSSDLGLVYF